MGIGIQQTGQSHNMHTFDPTNPWPAGNLIKENDTDKESACKQPPDDQLDTQVIPSNYMADN